ETNGFSVRKGHTLLTNLVAVGEVPLALTVFNYTAEQFKRKGAPIDWFALDPVVVHPNAVAVVANPPHPHAAVLMFDFVLSEAQQLFADRHYVATSLKVASTLDRASVHMLDASKVVAEGDKWQRLYTSTRVGEAGGHHAQDRNPEVGGRARDRPARPRIRL